ncbi:MAG: hypothetical protein QWI36_03515 [Wolbachia endosymbiont of Tyrophagus putrescentiae]|nr:hypothetical protein [Wolbachia endosymbiont of Tyrophagus putrescentiae]
MSGMDIADLQAAQEHKEQSGGKSGFGLGHGESASTILDGMQWLFTAPGGVLGAYMKVLESWAGSIPSTLGDGMELIGGVAKLIDALKQCSEYGAGGDGGMPLDFGDYSHANEFMGADDFGGHMHFDNDYHGQSFSPSPSPAVGSDHGHDEHYID